MRKVLEKQGYEVWARWDSEANIFELFNDSDAVCYVGFASDLKECVTNGTWWIDEQLAEAKWNES
jgi:hypothetical protein